ncbi:MAG TPA: carboxymuconolactone decarboxylase family protein [Gemmatimonadaceae bacterium]|nr:carboxymuconolactone decarboxylase family protein [Gemmatimonadaceae bacterium]
MTLSRAGNASVPALDSATAALVRQSARITAGSEAEIRAGFAECVAAKVSQRWQEELILQSYLFAGFPRALNAAREWRRSQEISFGEASAQSPDRLSGTSFIDGQMDDYSSVYDWRERGEATCATVYGKFYEKLRGNIRELSPSLDEWMIVEGYGKVLSRPGLDLGRRELCIVAACAAAEQDRQLHSHLHGAVNAGVPQDVVKAAIGCLDGIVSHEVLSRALLLFARVVGKV